MEGLSLLLLDAAKRTNHEFDTAYHSLHHACTTRSADDGVSKMVKYLIEERIAHQSEDGAKIF